MCEEDDDASGFWISESIPKDWLLVANMSDCCYSFFLNIYTGAIFIYDFNKAETSNMYGGVSPIENDFFKVANDFESFLRCLLAGTNYERELINTEAKGQHINERSIWEYANKLSEVAGVEKNHYFWLEICGFFNFDNAFKIGVCHSNGVVYFTQRSVGKKYDGTDPSYPKSECALKALDFSKL